MWGERVPSDRRGGVLLACAVAGAVGMVVAPALEQRKPWINYEALTRGFAPAHVERFDWTQRYGPLNWPHTGNTVLEVKSAPTAGAEYWKTENLDSFDGRAGPRAAPPRAGSAEQRAARRKRGDDQALDAEPDRDDPRDEDHADDRRRVRAALRAPHELAGAGRQLGTWMTTTQLAPGTATPFRCTPRIRAPPSSRARARTIRATSRSRPRADDAAESARRTSVRPQQVLFPPFGTGAAPQDQTDAASFRGAAALRSSPYWPAYNARASRSRHRRRRRTRTCRSVMRYLTAGNGYSYDQNPPLTAVSARDVPVRQPSSATASSSPASMALLLRMGGVPARVATGFTTGNYDSATKQLGRDRRRRPRLGRGVVPALRLGPFDPTPASAPARGGHIPRSPRPARVHTARASSAAQPARRPRHRRERHRATTAAQRRRSLGTVLLIALAVVLRCCSWSRCVAGGGPPRSVPNDSCSPSSSERSPAAGVRSPTA